MPSGVYTPTKRGRHSLKSGKYPVRYMNPITKIISSSSRYTNKDGVRKSVPDSCMEYLVEGKWIPRHLAPHRREYIKTYSNTKNAFFSKILSDIRKRCKKNKERGREIQGENEFEDTRPGRCDKLIAQFDEQVERYGNKCPVTHIPFTMNVNHNFRDINNYVRTFSNISPDRIFNHMDYTKQNLIFTSQLWNFKKGESSLYELELVFQPEIVERYKAIVMERFPDQKYALQA